MAPIHAVLFDLGDTLVDLGEGRGDYEDRVFARAGRIYDLLASAGLDLPERDSFSHRLADGTEERYRQALADRKGIDIYTVLSHIYQEMNLPVEASLLEASAETYCNGGPAPAPLREGARDLLLRLREEGLRLGVVSNTIQPGRFLDAALQRRGILDFFPVRVYSSDQGVAKPHPAIFQAALRALGATAAESLYVGDRLEADIAGAHGVGMRAVLVAVPHRPERDSSVQPDARITSLMQLPDVLASFA